MEENKKPDDELDLVSGGALASAGANRVHVHEGEGCSLCTWGKLVYVRDQDYFGKLQEVYQCDKCGEYETFNVKE